jgi:hypothetical protein
MQTGVCTPGKLSTVALASPAEFGRENPGIS